MRCPRSAIERASSGYASAQRPWMKNVVTTPSASSVSRTRSVAPARWGRSGCSASNVRATRKVMLPGDATGAGNASGATSFLDAGDDDPAGEEALGEREGDERG